MLGVLFLLFTQGEHKIARTWLGRAVRGCAKHVSVPLSQPYVLTDHRFASTFHALESQEMTCYHQVRLSFLTL